MNKGYNIDTGDVAVSYFCNNDSSIHVDSCNDRYEIIFSLSSLGTCIVEGNEHILNPGSILIIPPLNFHVCSYGVASNIEGYSVKFMKSAIDAKVLPMLDKIFQGSEEGGRFYSSDCILDPINDIFRRFEDAFLLPDEEKKAFLSMLINELIIFLSVTEGISVSRADNELGVRVAKYLNSNIEKNISLDRLATRFFVSKYHLCHAFKKFSGISVHSYINHKRIMYAKQLIESGECASAVAEKVGFGDYSSFYRAYVKIVGKAPTKE